VQNVDFLFYSKVILQITSRISDGVERKQIGKEAEERCREEAKRNRKGGGREGKRVTKKKGAMS